MRLKLTLVLVLLNLVLFTLIFYLEKESSARARFEEAQTLILPPGAVDAAIRLEISGNALAAPWVLERSNNRWDLLNPQPWPANKFAVERLLNQLRFAQWETRFSLKDMTRAGQTLADYGLERPAATISLRTENDTYALRIGQTTEIGNRLYLLSPEANEILVVERELLTTFAMPLDDLRRAEVLDLSLFEVRSFSLQGGSPPGPKVIFTRSGQDWLIEAPIRATANTQAVENTLNKLTQLQGITYPNVQAEEHGLAQPTLRITLEGSTQRQTLLLGNPLPTDKQTAELPLLYARLEDNPTLFTLPAEAFSNLYNAQESLREHSFLKFNRNDLSLLEISHEEQSLRLERLETGAWQVAGTQANGGLRSWPADQQILDQTLSALQHLEAVRFVTDAPSAANLSAYGLDQPQRRVKLSGQREQTLLLGDLETESNLLYARLQEAPSVYLVSPSILVRLPVRPLHYRLRKLAPLPTGAQITALRLTAATTNIDQLDSAQTPPPDTLSYLDVALEEAPDWTTALAAEEETTVSATEALLTLLRDFPVRQYLREGFTGFLALDRETTHPWAYRLDVDILLPGGGEAERRTDTYYLTERLGGEAQFGGDPQRDLLFSLTQAWIDALFPLTFQREVPQTPSATPILRPVQQEEVTEDEEDPSTESTDASSDTSASMETTTDPSPDLEASKTVDAKSASDETSEASSSQASEESAPKSAPDEPPANP